MKRTKTISIKEALDEFAARTNIAPQIDEARVAAAWKAVAGYFANAPSVISFHRGNLYLRINSPAVRNELMMHRSQFALLMNEKLGARMVENIVIQ